MDVRLSPRLEALVRAKVGTGQFTNPSEVVSEALQLMEERDRLNQLRDAIAIGDAQYVSGDVMTWTATSLDELQREADHEDRQGLPMCDDIQP